jgi:hypothetical protein
MSQPYIVTLFEGPSSKFAMISTGILLAAAAIYSWVNPGNQWGNGSACACAIILIGLGFTLVYFHHGEQLKNLASSDWGDSSSEWSDMLSRH